MGSSHVSSHVVRGGAELLGAPRAMHVALMMSALLLCAPKGGGTAFRSSEG